MQKFLDDCVILKIGRAKKINKLGELGLRFSEFPWSLFFFLLMEDTKLHVTQRGTLFCYKDVAHQHIRAQAGPCQMVLPRVGSSRGGAAATPSVCYLINPGVIS